MRFILPLLLALLTSCAGTIYQPKTLDGKALATYLMSRRAGVIAPLAGGNGESGNLGSAVPIHPKGYLLTASHVVAGANCDNIQVIVTQRTGDPSKPLKARVVVDDKRSDVALLKVEADTPSYFRWTPAGATLPVGLRVVHTGLKTGHKTGIGELTSPLPQGRAGKFGHTLRLQPGDSGGGLVSISGELIGVNSAIGTIEGFGASFFSGAVSSRPSVRRIENAIAKDQAAH